MNEVRLGCVGLRRGLDLSVVAAHDPRVKIVAVCDPNLDACKDRVKAQFDPLGVQFEKTYEDFGEFLSHDMDAVIIASPPTFHASQSIAAMNVGLDVLSEIPVAWSLDEAYDLVNAVRKTGRFYMTAENLCYMGMTDTWKGIVRDGRIGKPLYAEGEYAHDVRHMFHESWMNDTSPKTIKNEDKKTWRANLHPARYCTHEVGPLLEIMEDRVIQVMAVDTGSNVSPETGSIDMAVALMKTEKGAVIKEITAFCVALPTAHRYFKLQGSKGFLETSRWSGSHCQDVLAYFADVPNLRNAMKLSVNPSPGGSHPSWIYESGHDGVDGLMLLDFIDSLLEKRPSPIDVYRGLDYSLPGMLGCASAEAGGTWMDVPDSRGWCRP